MPNRWDYGADRMLLMLAASLSTLKPTSEQFKTMIEHWRKPFSSLCSHHILTDNLFSEG